MCIRDSDYGSIGPAAIRTNYGINRTAGGGMALRAVSCLPALTGAWRHPAGGVLLSSSGNYPVDTAALAVSYTHLGENQLGAG